MVPSIAAMIIDMASLLEVIKSNTLASIPHFFSMMSYSWGRVRCLSMFSRIVRGCRDAFTFMLLVTGLNTGFTNGDDPVGGGLILE